MNQLSHFIVVATLAVLTGWTSACCASIETGFDSDSIVDKMSADSGNDRKPSPKPHVEQGDETPDALPSSISSSAFGGTGSGLTAALLTASLDIQLGPNHKVYLQSCFHWPIPPSWKMLKVPISGSL